LFLLPSVVCRLPWMPLLIGCPPRPRGSWRLCSPRRHGEGGHGESCTISLSGPWAAGNEPVSKRQREGSDRHPAIRARFRPPSWQHGEEESRLRLPCQWSFFTAANRGPGRRGDFRTVSQVPREQLRRDSQVNGPEHFRPAPACRCLGRWRGVWWCGYPWAGNYSPQRRHMLPACQQPRQPLSPQTSTSAPKGGGRRYTAHTSMLGSCFWSPPAMPDAVQPRQQQIRPVQAGLLRPQRASAGLVPWASAGGFSGPWLPVPRGYPSFSSQPGHGCHGGATSVDTLLDFSDTLGYASQEETHVKTRQDVG
jgi:hypothetical protein